MLFSKMFLEEISGLLDDCSAIVRQLELCSEFFTCETAKDRFSPPEIMVRVTHHSIQSEVDQR